VNWCNEFIFFDQGFGEDGSGTVQTAWALLGLLAADCQDKVAMRRGMKYLMDKQVRAP
jgi:hypothetical protein